MSYTVKKSKLSLSSKAQEYTRKRGEKTPYDCARKAHLYTEISTSTAFCNQRRNDISPLTPNGPYRGRIASLTSKRCILYIYSTNIGTEYFKHGINSPCFFLNAVFFQNSNVFDSCIIHILYTGYAKI